MSIIYKLTNKVNGKFYIGKTNNMKRRWKGHRQAAKDGEPYHIARSIAKYGSDNFEMTVLEEGIEESLINERERYWISELNPDYNMTPGGDGWSVGMKHKESTKRKLAVRMLGELNPIHNINQNGANNHMFGRNGSKHHNAKTYKFTSPEGEVQESIGLAKFCRDHNLNVGNMCWVAKGKLKHYKGWKCELVEHKQ